MTTTQTVESQQASTLELQDHAQGASTAIDTNRLAPKERPAHPTNTPILKMLACGYSFFISGLNDGCLGPLIPYMLVNFRIGTGKVAVIYACTFVGWAIALPINPIISRYLPLGSLLFLGAALQAAAQLMRPWAPFALFAVSFFVNALGMALQDSHGNTFVSGANVAHRWLGFIHASYAGGLVVAPIFATAIASTGGTIGGIESWRATYFVLIGANALNLAGTTFAFRDTIRWRIETPNSAGEQESSKLGMNELIEPMKTWSLWAISLSFFLQLGAMMTAAGWVVQFLVEVRGGDLSKMGYVPTGCNAGTFVGRLVLAEPIHRLGEKRTVLAFFFVILGFQLIFWLVPSIIGSAVALSLMGFFSGPFFPVGVSIASKSFPRKTRSAALSFIFVLAQAGATFFPSLTGLIAQRAGVGVLQPIITALLILGGICWWRVPNVGKEGAVEQRQD